MYRLMLILVENRHKPHKWKYIKCVTGYAEHVELKMSQSESQMVLKVHCDCNWSCNSVSLKSAQVRPPVVAPPLLKIGFHHGKQGFKKRLVFI